MNYGILQNPIPSNSQQLEKYLGKVTWQYLEPHFHNGSLIYIDNSLCIKDVAKAFVDLALSPKTTAAVITVDGGNIAAAMR